MRYVIWQKTKQPPNAATLPGIGCIKHFGLLRMKLYYTLTRRPDGKTIFPIHHIADRAKEALKLQRVPNINDNDVSQVS